VITNFHYLYFVKVYISKEKHWKFF